MLSRLVLDTNVFRSMHVGRLAALTQRGFKLTVSETAIAETWARSVTEYEAGMSRAQALGLLFRRAQRLKPFIDPEWPIAANGEYLVTRIQAQLGESVVSTRLRESNEHVASLRAAWNLLSGIGYNDEQWVASGRRHRQFLAEQDATLAKLGRRDAEIDLGESSGGGSS